MFVVGEIRDERTGAMRNFVGDTIAAWLDAGCVLYNHAVMLLPPHTLPMRARAQFEASAKLGMCHQHVLVFYSGREPSREVRSIGLPASRQFEWI